MSDERADVLRFWRAIELFSPQAVPEISPDEYAWATGRLIDPGRGAPDASPALAYTDGDDGTMELDCICTYVAELGKGPVA
jgi:hypothetical protein